MVALLLSAACAPSGAPSGSDAGGAATGTATTTPPQTASSPAASPDAASTATAVPKVAVTLFKNVRIFDGKAGKLTDPGNVMVRGNIIERVSSRTIETPADANVIVIDGGGRTLMPGLIDAHWHAMLVRPPVASLLTADTGYLNLLAGAEATDTLLRGFTTVRDVSGSRFGLKQAIDHGVLAGPRIFPSGAIITITGGHGDFRPFTDLPRTLGAPLTRQETTGASMVADSPDEVRVRVREQLMQGASQIKLTAGGGVASPHSPLDASTFTEPELRAAVEAAENWGTYVTAHAYTPATIKRAIAAGVKCIEHGQLMDESTAKLMAERGIWLSIQPFPEELGNAFPPGSDEREKFQEVFVGTDRAYALAKKYRL
ncbi:MAG TPA: amidohydrolase family protein, partial [Steroidobacteraceae bacterium]